jgi:hypothetical protein
MLSIRNWDTNSRMLFRPTHLPLLFKRLDVAPDRADLNFLYS